MGLTADYTLWQERLESLKTLQQKLSKLNSKKKDLKKKSIEHNELQNNFKLANVHVVGATKGNGDTEKIFEEIMTKIFLNLMNAINSQIQEMQ